MATGVSEAQRRIGRLVLGPIWKGLSDMDRNFLLAMAQDDGESRIADIADRLEVSASYASVYRQRLIRAGMIVSAGRGRIDVGSHATRSWLRSQMPTSAP